MDGLTERQKEIYNFIVSFRNEKGYSPTFREIGKGCYMSTTTVCRHVDKMVNKGFINYIPTEPRTIRPAK